MVKIDSGTRYAALYPKEYTMADQRPSVRDPQIKNPEINAQTNLNAHTIAVPTATPIARFLKGLAKTAAKPRTK